MRTAYEEYATALNVFLGVEAQWNANKEQLESASRDYETAKAELDKANKALTSYLDKIKKKKRLRKPKKRQRKKQKRKLKKQKRKLRRQRRKLRKLSLKLRKRQIQSIRVQELL